MCWRHLWDRQELLELELWLNTKLVWIIEDSVHSRVMFRYVSTVIWASASMWRIAAIEGRVPHYSAPLHCRFGCPWSKRLVKSESRDFGCRMQELSQQAVPQSTLETCWYILSCKRPPTLVIKNSLPFPDGRMHLFPPAVRFHLLSLPWDRDGWGSGQSIPAFTGHRPSVNARSIDIELPSWLMCGTWLLAKTQWDAMERRERAISEHLTVGKIAIVILAKACERDRQEADFCLEIPQQNHHHSAQRLCRTHHVVHFSQNSLFNPKIQQSAFKHGLTGKSSRMRVVLVVIRLVYDTKSCQVGSTFTFFDVRSHRLCPVVIRGKAIFW